MAFPGTAKVAAYDEEPTESKPSKAYSDTPIGDDDDDQAYYHWSKRNGVFRPVGHTQDEVPAGIYEIDNDNSGWFLSRVKFPSDNLLRLPGMPIDYILNQIDTFWKREELFKQTGLLHKRGILMYGPAGCHAAGTEVVMYDGSLRKVEDVIVGDLLMGPDGTKRTVLALRRGQDSMYEVRPVKGEPFVVNGHHIFSLARSSKKGRRYPSVMNISLNDYLGLSECSKESFKLQRTGAMAFANVSSVSLDPYFLGAWLGDGSEEAPAITTADVEIKELCYAAAASNGLSVTTTRKTDSKCYTYSLVGDGTKGNNPIINELKKFNVWGNKHIPEDYFRSSVEDRLQLLAGLIDTDGGNEGAWRPSARYNTLGSAGNGKKRFFSITQKREVLAYGILRLARSLGFGATIRPVTKTIKSRGFSGSYYRVHIYGDIHRIPVRLPRKKQGTGDPNKNHLHTGISKIIPLGIGDYFGFTLSDDHLYLTRDFTVHHNCGKTSLIRLLCDDLVNKRDGIVVMVTNCRLAETALGGIRQIEPRRPILTIIEDIETFMGASDESSSARALLALLDGETQVDHIVHLATTNKPDQLEDRIVKRPGRFDLVVGLNHPVADARRAYLENLLHDHVSASEMNTLVKETEGLGLAHLRELVVANYCLGLDREETLKRLRHGFKEKLKVKGSETPLGFTTVFPEKDGKIGLK